MTPALPVIRDPDGFIYYKEEVGGLVMGGFEPVAKPWNPPRIPDNFEFQLFPEDWDQFEILMENAIHRTPCLETAEIKMLLNGPESFTGDGNFILGRSAGGRRLFRLRRIQLRGHRQFRRRGPADRRMDRRRRSAARPVGRRHPPLRAVPREPQAPGRPHGRVARPALRDALAARGAADGAAAAPLAALRPAAREAARCSAPSSTGSAPTISCRRAPTRRPTRSARRAGCRSSSKSSAPAARTSSCSTRRRSPNSSSRAATRWPSCSGCAPTTSTCPSARWSTRRCSTSAADSRAT